ncbi:uncharacterized protein LOC127080254 [Lathyrus oleraceus]|uniref:uncharacterized protein LOC127080254 n=1 Tax=Pisum sativum TaxID=3888 RepID=UPI0021CE81D3|nr:uncharacterized protein LOC127080254 [Pisum sativum]
MEASGAEITWEMFKTAFMDKYFLVDVCIKKEIKFIGLTQGNMTMEDYAVKFEELSKLCATHSFISLDCAMRLNLELSFMSMSMVINTSVMDSVTISMVCLNYPLSIFDRDFIIDLVRLPLVQLDVILGMSWLEFDRVHINCYARKVMFTEFMGEKDMFVSTKKVNESMKNDALVLMMLASLDVKGRGVIGELSVVCDFPDVFPDNINDFSQEREVEFSIDLVPGTSPV